MVELEVGDRSVPTFQVHLDPGGGAPPGSLAGACPPVQSSLTDASFDGGSYILQAGFAEGEMAGASFTIDPAQFPVKIDLLEVLAGTNNATVTTTTEWTALFYEGTPRDGTLRYSFSSDGKSPAPRGATRQQLVNIQLLIDPGDPEQIIPAIRQQHLQRRLPDDQQQPDQQPVLRRTRPAYYSRPPIPAA